MKPKEDRRKRVQEKINKRISDYMIAGAIFTEEGRKVLIDELVKITVEEKTYKAEEEGEWLK